MPQKQAGKVAIAGVNYRPEQTATVLFIGPFQEDLVCLEGILNPPGWEVRGACTLREALIFLRVNPSPVAICEAELMASDWKDALQALLLLAYPPAFIVASRLADHRLWTDVLKAGGYDVLAKPFHANEVNRVVQLACLEWQCRRAQAGGLRVPAPGLESAG